MTLAYYCTTLSTPPLLCCHSHFSCLTAALPTQRVGLLRGMLPTVAACTKLETLMSCLVTHQKSTLFEAGRWGEVIRSCNHSLSLAHHLLIWEALQGGHCKGYIKSKQNCQAFLSPTFVLANLHPLMKEASFSAAEHHVQVGLTQRTVCPRAPRRP